jgi:hypothetical protein
MDDVLKVLSQFDVEGCIVQPDSGQTLEWCYVPLLAAWLHYRFDPDVTENHYGLFCSAIRLGLFCVRTAEEMYFYLVEEGMVGEFKIMRCYLYCLFFAILLTLSGSDLTSFGAYGGPNEDCLAYLRFGWIWVELHFFRDLHRNHFLDGFGLSYRRSSVCRCEEGDPIDFHLFNASDDSDGLAFWGGRNVHEKWLTSAGQEGESEAVSGSGDSIAFVWHRCREYMRRSSRVICAEDSELVDRIWLLEFPYDWILC